MSRELRITQAHYKMREWSCSPNIFLARGGQKVCGISGLYLTGGLFEVANTFEGLDQVKEKFGENVAYPLSTERA